MTHTSEATPGMTSAARFIFAALGEPPRPAPFAGFRFTSFCTASHPALRRERGRGGGGGGDEGRIREGCGELGDRARRGREGCGPRKRGCSRWRKRRSRWRAHPRRERSGRAPVRPTPDAHERHRGRARGPVREAPREAPRSRPDRVASRASDRRAPAEALCCVITPGRPQQAPRQRSIFARPPGQIRLARPINGHTGRPVTVFFTDRRGRSRNPRSRRRRIAREIFLFPRSKRRCRAMNFIGTTAPPLGRFGRSNVALPLLSSPPRGLVSSWTFLLCGIAPGTVRSRLLRALARARGSLAVFAVALGGRRVARRVLEALLRSLRAPCSPPPRRRTRTPRRRAPPRAPWARVPPGSTSRASR